MECWQGQQHAVFVAAGAAAIFLLDSLYKSAAGEDSSSGEQGDTLSTEEMLCLHPQCPWHARGWKVALNPGRREGDAGSHFLAISVSLLFFFPWYLLLKVVCDVMLSLEKASAPSQQGNPFPSHLYFQGEDLPSGLCAVSQLCLPWPHGPSTAREGVQPHEQDRGVQEPPGSGGKPCLSQHRSGGFEVWEK